MYKRHNPTDFECSERQIRWFSDELDLADPALKPELPEERRARTALGLGQMSGVRKRNMRDASWDGPDAGSENGDSPDSRHRLVAVRRPRKSSMIFLDHDSSTMLLTC